MIVAHAVEVVQMEDQRATAPLGYSAVGADVGKDSLIDETPLQAVAIGVRTVLDEDLRQRYARRPRVVLASQVGTAKPVGSVEPVLVYQAVYPAVAVARDRGPELAQDARD